MYTLVNFSTASNTTTGIGPQFVVCGPNMRINDGGVVSDSTSVSLARLQTAYDTADAWAEVVVDELDGESDIGVIIRTTSSGLDADSRYYFARMNNGKLQLLSKTATGTGLSGLGSSVLYTPSVGDVLRVEIRGTTLRGYINGSVFQTVTVSSLADSGTVRYGGMRLKSSLATKIRTYRAGDYGANEDDGTPPTPPATSSITNGTMQQKVGAGTPNLIFEGISDGQGGIRITTLARVTPASEIGITAPNAPTSLSATAGINTLSVSCAAPANNGSAITDYVWSLSTTDATTGFSNYVDGQVNSTTATLTGRAAVPHWIRVAAVNGVGMGSWSTVFGPITPQDNTPPEPDPTAPGAPTNLSVTAGAGSLSASLTAPSDNGSPITDYIWSLSTTSASSGFSVYSDGVSASTSTTISGRSSVPHWIRVAAVNAIGTGPWSTVFGPVTPTEAAASGYGPLATMTDPPALPSGFTPTRTVNVSTAAQLTTALANAASGDLITLAPNTTYNSKFVIANKNGTASKPIIIRGPRSAILDYTPSSNGTGSGYGFHIDNCDYVHLSGFTLRNVQKGIMADEANFCVIKGVRVHKIGDEAIHFRNYSSDNLVEDCTIHDTGNRTPDYGEGVYLGQAHSNWDASYSRTNGNPDASNRNTVRRNHIYDTTGECIDIKEGTINGLIEYNKFGGESLNNDNFSDTWVDAKGSGYTIRNNYGEISLAGGYSTSQQGGTGFGKNNIFRNNKGDCRRRDGTISLNYGIEIKNSNDASHGNIVYSDNVLLNTAHSNSVTNITVTPA